jgi:hypothetical protein
VYLESITPAIGISEVSAMLGDGTVTRVNTLDLKNVQSFYQRLSNKLSHGGWASAGTSRSITEDLHRLYFQFSKTADKFHVIGYFGIQFHALLYYRVDKRVIEIQKELATIADKATAVFNVMTDTADKVLQIELERMGYASLQAQELFMKMFDDEKLVEDLDKKASSVEIQYPEFEELRDKKNSLFSELKDLLLELYQTSPVFIDYNRLMQGEEGVTTYFDIEVIRSKKTKAREAYLNTEAFTSESADMISTELYHVAETLRNSE